MIINDTQMATRQLSCYIIAHDKKNNKNANVVKDAPKRSTHGLVKH